MPTVNQLSIDFVTCLEVVIGLRANKNMRMRTHTHMHIQLTLHTEITDPCQECIYLLFLSPFPLLTCKIQPLRQQEV